MKYLVLLLILPCLCACSSSPQPDSTPAEIELAIEVGKRMGMQADTMPHGSMQHIHAILAIRARETAIRDAGYTVAADSFAASAARQMQF